MLASFRLVFGIKLQSMFSLVYLNSENDVRCRLYGMLYKGIFNSGEKCTLFSYLYFSVIVAILV